MKTDIEAEETDIEAEETDIEAEEKDMSLLSLCQCYNKLSVDQIAS